jgi:ParB/RepB/Spo0J family partition protein
MSVDKLQDAEEAVNQMREEVSRAARDAQEAELRRAPIADTASKAHTSVTAPLTQIRTMVNMRVGALPELHELAVSIKETGVLAPPLVRATGDADQPYELLAGRRRFGAMGLLDAADGPRDDWRFTLVEAISRREALTMQFAENFHQNKPEPIQFARAARAIMAEDETLTAADVSRLVGAPTAWTRKALRMLDLPESIVQRVERGDLAFTVADVVRRGIARGDVSPERAQELVEQAADGQISPQELKHGVGYVPPPPKDYDELSRELDHARWTAARDKTGSNEPIGADAEQRDWESSNGGSGGSGGPGGGGRGASTGPTGGGPAAFPGGELARTGGAAGTVSAPTDAHLDAYLLGRLLAGPSGTRHRETRGVTDPDDAFRYAFSLPPDDRLDALRSLAAELLAADPDPPRVLRAA